MLSQLIMLSDSLSQGGGQSQVPSSVDVRGVPSTAPTHPLQSIPPPPFTPGASVPLDFRTFREATPRLQRGSRHRESARGHGSRSRGATRGGSTRSRSPSSHHRQSHSRGRSREDQGGRPSKYRRGGEYYSDESGSSYGNSSGSSGASRYAPPSPPPPPAVPQIDLEVTV